MPIYVIAISFGGKLLLNTLQNFTISNHDSILNYELKMKLKVNHKFLQARAL